MAKIITWLVVLLINLCLAQSENLEVTKNAKATVDKSVDRPAKMIASSTTEGVVVISEKSLAEIQIEQAHKNEANIQAANPEEVHSRGNSGPNEYEKVMQQMDVENSVRTGFYLLMTISVGALLFVGWKIFKLRMSRAERKYGVQGDRTTQELAPLPISMEDADSDEEDQTIFDAHRNQIRIF